MKRIIDIPDETYNNFIHNEYYRTDIIAVHTALVYSTPYETVTEFADRCRECGAKYGKLLKQYPKIEQCNTCKWYDEDRIYNPNCENCCHNYEDNYCCARMEG